MIKVVTLGKALEDALAKKQEIEAAQQLLSQLQTEPGVCHIDHITRGLPISLYLEPCISSTAITEMLLKYIPAEILDGPVNTGDAEVLWRIVATRNKLRHAVKAASSGNVSRKQPTDCWPPLMTPDPTCPNCGHPHNSQHCPHCGFEAT